MTPILEHLFSTLTSWSFKPVPFQSRNCSVQWTAAKECLVKAYITTELFSKTLLFSRSDKRHDFAWNRQQTEWSISHTLAALIWLYTTIQPRIIFSSNNSSSASPMRRCADHISQVLLKEISQECELSHACLRNYLLVTRFWTICQTVNHFKAS